MQARNPALSREQIEAALFDYLGTDKVLWLGRGIAGDDTHGHIDDLARFVAPDTVVLLPLDPDASATRIRDEIAGRARVTVAVVITDTFGRAWREGHTNVAIGIAGLPALKRYIGQRDPEGYELRVTEIAIADEVAAAAELVMGKLDRCPAALVRGIVSDESSETARDYVRPAEKDLEKLSGVRYR